MKKTKFTYFCVLAGKVEGALLSRGFYETKTEALAMAAQYPVAEIWRYKENGDEPREAKKVFEKNE